MQPPPPMDFKRHIAENIAKGSSMCPFGSTTMKKAMMSDNNSSKKDPELPQNFDLLGYDPDAPDSDDDPLSDVEA